MVLSQLRLDESRSLHEHPHFVTRRFLVGEDETYGVIRGFCQPFRR